MSFLYGWHLIVVGVGFLHRLRQVLAGFSPCHHSSCPFKCKRVYRHLEVSIGLALPSVLFYVAFRCHLWGRLPLRSQKTPTAASVRDLHAQKDRPLVWRFVLSGKMRLLFSCS